MRLAADCSTRRRSRRRCAPGRWPEQRSTCSGQSRTRGRCSSSSRSSSLRISPARRPRLRIGLGSSSRSRSPLRSTAGSCRQRSTSPSSSRANSRCSARTSRWRRSSDGWRWRCRRGRPGRIVVAVHGPLSEHDTRLLTVAALNGLFQDRVDETVDFVNAPVIAAERGIEVSEQRFVAVAPLHEPRPRRPRRRREVTNSRSPARPSARSTACSSPERSDMPSTSSSRGSWRSSSYDDVPGVIGKVGTMFGEAGVNIANMAVSRTSRAGTRSWPSRSTPGAARARGARRGGRVRRREIGQPWLRSRRSARAVAVGWCCSSR